MSALAELAQPLRDEERHLLAASIATQLARPRDELTDEPDV